MQQKKAKEIKNEVYKKKIQEENKMDFQILAKGIALAGCAIGAGCS